MSNEPRPAISGDATRHLWPTSVRLGMWYLVVFGGGLASSQTTSQTPPPPLTEYYGRTIAQTMHFAGAPWLVRESRQREEDCQQMLRQLRLAPGQQVCDMGSGNGFYTLQLAEAVGTTGRVFAVDIQQEMLRLLEERLEATGLENVELVLGSVVDPRLPPDRLDLILCVDVYHELSHPEQMLAAMRRALKPAGQLVLVEFRAEDPDVPIKPLHKMSKKQVLLELEPNGFRLAREYDGLPWQHMMFFQRDGDAAAEPVEREPQQQE